MVEKITIKPTKVRGHGNVLNPKTIDEFTKLNCTMEEIENNELNLTTFKLNSLFFDLWFNHVTSQPILFANQYAIVSASVRYSNSNEITSDERLTDKYLQLYDNEEYVTQQKITSQGIWDHDWNLRFTEGDHNLKLKFEDSWSQIFPLHVKKEVGSVTLTNDHQEVYVGETITWTAIVKDIDNNPYVGVNVRFQGGTIDTTVTTDNEGKATFSYTHTGAVSSYGSVSYPIKASIGGKTSTTVTGSYWNHKAQSISCNVNTNEITIDDSVTMTVSLLDHFNNKVTGDICIEGASISEYDITSENNDYIITYTPTSNGNKSLKVYLCGYPYNVYTNVNITVNSTTTNLNLTAPTWAPYVENGTIECSAKLNNSTLNKGINNASLKVYVDNTLTNTITTNSNGVATFNVSTPTKANKNVQVVYEGGNGHDQSDATGTIYVGATLTLNITNKEE